MKLHRFFAGGLHDKYGPTELRRHIWVNDEALVSQWTKVLRYRVGDELVLFDGTGEDRLYKISKIEPLSVGLDLVTELEPQKPNKELYLFWSLLKKDKNEWILQKCTELGVSHFVPILSDRTEKTGFDEERAKKIVTEASEQCGRSDVPAIREAIGLEAAINEYKDKILLYYAEQHEEEQTQEQEGSLGVFVGPEGGWTEPEKELLEKHCIKINIAQFTLRAETACIVAASKLLM